MTRPYSQRDTDPDGYPHDYHPQIPSPVIPEHPSDYPRPLQQPTISQPHPQAPMVSFPQAEVDSQPANHEAVGRTFESPNHYQSQTMAASSNLRGRDEEEMPWRHPSADRNSTFDNRLSNDQTVTSHVHSTLSSVAGNSNGNFAPNSPQFPTALVAPVIPANADAGTRDMIGSSYRPGPNSYFPASPQSHLADPMGVGGSGRMFETAVIESRMGNATETHVLRPSPTLGRNIREDVIQESSEWSGHHRKSSSNNRDIVVSTRKATISTEYSYPPSSPSPMTAATSSGFSTMTHHFSNATQPCYVSPSPYERRCEQGYAEGSIGTSAELREAMTRVTSVDGGKSTYQRDGGNMPSEAKKTTYMMDQHHQEGPTLREESDNHTLKLPNQHLAVQPSLTKHNGQSDISHGETAASSFNSASPFDLTATTSRAGPNLEPYPLHDISGDAPGDNNQNRPTPGGDKKCCCCCFM
ncbi:hypothetical protein FRC02_008325 [Tulasnella sp. 418]|nr:hypothetical protein FRC02_008325 [Tulasnella sp. 418]